MARACARWSKISHYDAPEAWVYRVGLNWARSLHRRAARVLPMRERPVVVLPPIPDPAIAAALRALDVKLRAVVVCRLLLDWSRIGRIGGVQEIEDPRRLHHALRELESKLEHLR
jgi:DNA-directed RNA polymerase specialized sigma24 family protein